MNEPTAAPVGPAGGRRQPAANRPLAALLRSPLHRLASGSMLLISYRGRRSGAVRELPVQCAPMGDGWVVLVGRPETKSWWRNFIEPWPLTVVVKGRSIDAIGQVVDGGADEGADLAAAYFGRFRRAGRRHGLRVQRGAAPSADEARPAAGGLLFFEVRPAPGPAARRAPARPGAGPRP